MGHSYKGSHASTGVNATPPVAPVLSIPAHTSGSWTYAASAPDSWGIYVVPYTNPEDAFDVVDGGTFTYDFSALGGATVTVQGIDNGETVFETPSSNQVLVPT